MTLAYEGLARPRHYNTEETGHMTLLNAQSLKISMDIDINNPPFSSKAWKAFFQHSI